MNRETPEEARERMKSKTVGGRQQPPPRPVEQPRSPQGPDPRGASHRGAQQEAEDASTGDLVKQLTEQTKTLVQQEMRLAQAELKEKGKKVGIGAGMFGAGGLVAFYGAATLIAAIVLALSTAIAGWLSALIVAVVLLGVAGAAALMGKKKIEQATPPVPEQTVETVKEDVEHVKSKAKQAKR